MATIEELLNLSDKGWQDIAAMNDEQLKVYLADIFSLENKIKQSTIYKNKNENISNRNDGSDSSDDNMDFDSSDEDDALSKLKKSIEDEDSPFDKRKKYKKKKHNKVLSTYDIDIEAEKLKQELGL